MLSEKGFKKIERDLAVIKELKSRNEKDQLLLKLETDLKNIFNTEVSFNIIYSGYDVFNCLIMCYPNVPSNILEQNPQRNPNLHFVNINFGDKLFGLLEPREIVAVLLHEFRHWHYNYETVLPKVNLIIKRIRSLGSAGFFLFGTISGLPLFILMLLISGTSTSLLSHNIEYGCDEYAIKYGYGADLYSAFKKINKLEKKKSTSFRNIFDAIFKYLFGSSHPSFDDRLKKISGHLKNKYIDVYNTPKQKHLIEKYYQIKV